MWMGGVVPLGYRVENRALHIVEDHAELVRALLRRYLEAGSVARLKQTIDADGLRLPIRIDGVGRSTGGGLFSRGHIYKIFSNPIYIGQIAHKGQVHTGQHRPIVDRDLWDRVQQSLQDHLATGKARHERQSSDALLVGKLFDNRGNLMTPSWSRKGSKRWRYYVSQAVLRGDNTEAGSVARVSAPEIENKIIDAVGKLAQREGSEARPSGYEATAGDTPSREAGNAASDRHAEIRSLIDRVTLERTTIRIALSPDLEEHGEAKVLTFLWTRHRRPIAVIVRGWVRIYFANHTLTTDGIYCLVRHPQYTGIPPSGSLQRHSHLGDHPIEFRAHDLCGLLERSVIDRLHRGDGIDSRHFCLPIPRVAHYHVAGQHGAHFVLQQERLMRQGWVAGTKDDVFWEIDSNLCL
jgi:hypothetical protein